MQLNLERVPLPSRYLTLSSTAMGSQGFIIIILILIYSHLNSLTDFLKGNK